MAHTIFLLHGMGNAKPDWADPIMAALKKKYAEYQISDPKPFDESYEFCSLYYNDKFEEYLTAWNKNASDLGKWGKVLVPLSSPFVGKMTEIASGSAGDSFAVRYIGDVLLYMLTDIHELVESSVLAQIMAKLKPHAGGGWSIVSHSLGTRVMTDCLQALFTDPQFDAYTVYGKAKVVMTVANVGLLLQKLAAGLGLPMRGDVYHNTVFPCRTPARGTCGRFINTAHDLDPFLFPAPFVPPDDFGNAGALDRSLYQHVRIKATDLTGPNPHDFEHYLHHPDVHQALFQALVDPGGDPIFTDAEKSAQLAAYQKEVRDAALDALRKELEKLKLAPGGPKLQDLLDLLKKWKDLLKTLNLPDPGDAT